MLKLISKALMFWSRVGVQYNRVIQKGNKETSIRLGVHAIINSLVALAWVVGCAFGVTALFGNLSNIEINGVYEFPLLSIIGMVMLAAMAIYMFIQGVFGGLLYVIYQFRLNKRFISFLALFIWLGSIAGMIVAVYLIVL